MEAVAASRKMPIGMRFAAGRTELLQWVRGRQRQAKSENELSKNPQMGRFYAPQARRYCVRSLKSRIYNSVPARILSGGPCGVRGGRAWTSWGRARGRDMRAVRAPHCGGGAAHPCRVPGRRVGAVRGRVGVGAPDRRPFMRAAISSTALAAMKRAAGIADRASPAPRLLATPRNALRRSVQRQGIGGAHRVQARDVARHRPVSALQQPADALEDALLYQGGARDL